MPAPRRPGAPAAFGSLVAGRTGTERTPSLTPSLTWSVRAYVWHAADNLRIWAERLAGAGTVPRRAVAGYDQDALARARRDQDMPIGSAVWSLARAATDWGEAHRVVGDPAGVVIEHQAMGSFTLADVSRQVGHELQHHLEDVRRILAHRDGPG